MVNRLAGLVVMAAAAWGAVVLVLCAVQLARETVAWVANGGFGRLPGWAWPLIAAGVLGVVGVAWFRWLWPDEVGEEVDRRGEELGAAVGGIGRPVCPRCRCVLASDDGVKCPGCGVAVVSADDGERWIQMKDLEFWSRWREERRKAAEEGCPGGFLGECGRDRGDSAVFEPRPDLDPFRRKPAEGQEQGDNTARACDEAALRAAVAKDRGDPARCVGKESPYIDGRGGA